MCLLIGTPREASSTRDLTRVSGGVWRRVPTNESFRFRRRSYFPSPDMGDSRGWSASLGSWSTYRLVVDPYVTPRYSEWFRFIV